MAVAATSPELQCDHDQLVCPLENITCQCVVTGTNLVLPFLIWYLHSEIVDQFDDLGNSQVSNTGYTTTVEVLENALSSNLSFPSELQSGPLTVACVDGDAKSTTMSFSIEGLFFEV